MAAAKRKKRFFDVEIPSINKDTQVQAYEIQELEGKPLSYDLTRILRGKNILASFMIHISGEKATATPKGIKLMPSFIRRMIRKGTHQVDDSFETPTKDGKVLIKPFMITRRKVARKIRTSLRNKAHEELVAYAKEKTSEQIFDDILRNSLQKDLSLKLKKIYPLSLCEIRIMKIK